VIRGGGAKRMSRIVLIALSVRSKSRKKQLSRILCVPPGTIASYASYTMRRMSGTENEAFDSYRGGEGVALDHPTLGSG
jgi:hypothetical protein